MMRTQSSFIFISHILQVKGQQVVSSKVKQIIITIIILSFYIAQITMNSLSAVKIETIQEVSTEEIK